MATFGYNPITGQLDLVGSGGASYINGVVADPTALPVTVGTPALDSVYLAKAGSGVWLINRRPAGLYCRTANNGVAADWTYLGAFPEVNADGNWELYNSADPSKELKFDLSGITTGTTRTITVPDKNVTLDDASDSRTPTAHTHVSADITDATDAATANTIVRRDGVGGALFAATLEAADIFALGRIDAPEYFENDVSLASKYAAISHAHAAADITSGTLDIARIPTGTSSTTVCVGDDSRITGAIQSTTVDAKGDLLVASADNTITRLPVGTNNYVLTADSAEATGVKWAAASGGVSNVDSTLADVMSVSGSNLVADDGGLVDSSNPALVWDDAAGKAVWANPLKRTSAGAFYVGVAPTTTALGTNAVNIQPDRTNATYVAGGNNTVAIGKDSRTANNDGVAIGNNTLAGANSVAIGTGAQTFSNPSGAIAIGRSASANAIAYPIAIGGFSNASQESAIAIGANCDATAIRAVGIGQGADISLRGGFMTIPFGSVYWGGQTTNNTATILTLDASGTASDRFTIAANTALAVDILLVARRSDTQDKWLVARRFLGIRRDGSNNTSLIGAVQDYGLDQSAGSPTWTFALTADTTNHALQLEVTGATETVQWRATAFYRVA